ncbi:MAG: PilZ domain-containing protein [Sphingobium sp.]|nr:PilZ domain-containing protein [Sphingobium sp.]
MFFGRFSPKRASAASERAEPAQPDLRELARRAVARDIIDFHTLVEVAGNGAFDARLMDISPYGCQIRAYGHVLERGARVRVLLPGLGKVEAEAMWSLRGIFGCKFVQPVDSDLYAQLLPQLQGAHPDLNAPSA